jgi:phospholipid/cholesterol/gamma-HCH transport system ATP-binding protein
MNMIEIAGLWKSFGEKTIYTGLDLTVEKGESHVIVGRSGEGKSVLLKHITGLMTPDQGEVRVSGKTLWRDREALRWVRNNVAMVFQMAALFDSLTVYENVAFFWLENGGKTRGEMDDMVAELLELVDLPNTEHLFPSELSGGMRKRVGLARALACDPEIILYDEPTTGLDPVTSEVINELMIRARERQNMTAIVITHDMKSAYAVGDRISMLYEGRIIFTGTPEEMKNTDNPIVHQFVNGLAQGPITAGEDERMKTRVSMVIDRAKLHLE